jgi:hypothetical protein
MVYVMTFVKHIGFTWNQLQHVIQNLLRLMEEKEVVPYFKELSSHFPRETE